MDLVQIISFVRVVSLENPKWSSIQIKKCPKSREKAQYSYHGLKTQHFPIRHTSPFECRKIMVFGFQLYTNNDIF